MEGERVGLHYPAALAEEVRRRRFVDLSMAIRKEGGAGARRARRLEARPERRAPRPQGSVYCGCCGLPGNGAVRACSGVGGPLRGGVSRHPALPEAQAEILAHAQVNDWRCYSRPGREDVEAVLFECATPRRGRTV